MSTPDDLLYFVMIKILNILVFATFLSACNAELGSHRKEPEVNIMSSTQKYVVSSPLSGVLIENGKPLTNTKIFRILRWNGNDSGLVETFVTDNEGRFFLPVHEEELSLGVLAQFVASSKLEVELNGTHIDVWYNNKFEKDMYAETDGPISGLICEVTESEIVVETGLSKVMTICRWDNMPASEI